MYFISEILTSVTYFTTKTKDYRNKRLILYKTRKKKPAN